MTEGFRHFIRYQFPAILWACTIFVVSSIPGSKLPGFAHLVNDKVIHASIFFVLGLLVYRAFEPRLKYRGFDWRRLLVSISAVVLYGISDEIHQGFVPGRSVDVNDALADSVGSILSAALIYYRYLREKARIAAAGNP